MDTQELLKRLRRIEIKSSRLSEDIFSGAYRSAFKGRGMSFSEVREYQPGDDVRDIDWNVTARYARPYVKVYEEERELTMILLVDISRSEHFGTVGMTKRQRVAEIAGTLAFSTIKNNDNVGVIFYSDRVEKYIPPSKGHKHVLTILSEILSIEPEGVGTDISVALRFAHNVQRKSCTLFLLSDFIDGSDYAKTLAVVRNKHDLLAMQVYDPHEAELPMVGLLRVRDSETGEVRMIDSSSKSVRKQYHDYWQELSVKLRETFSKYNIGYASVSTSEDYVPRLQRLFTHPRI